MATFNRDKTSGVIYMHQFIDGKRFRISTGIKVSEKNWIRNKPLNNLVKYDGDSVAGLLKTCEYNLTRAISDLTTDGGGMTRLKELYIQHTQGKRTIRKTGIKFMEFFKSDYEKQKDRTTTWKHYRTTYRVLEEYFNGKDPSFDEIDMDFYRDFNSWMRKEKEYMESNINGHWKRIKTVMKLAEDANKHKNSTYTKFKRENYDTDKIALTAIELEKLAWAVLPEKLDLIRDYFLLSCFTGSRISDWDQLSTSAVKDGIWEYTANKTKEKAMVKISPRVTTILDKYNGKLPGKPYADSTINEIIKEVCKLSGITDKTLISVVKGAKVVNKLYERWEIVSSHTGRRTFATILIHLGVPVYLVMAQGGWKTLTSFESYIKLKKIQTEEALKDPQLKVV